MGQGGNGQGSGLTLSLARLVQQIQQEQRGTGSGIGSGSDPDRTGGATELAANLNRVTLTGTVGRGKSQVRTESSNEPHLESSAAAVTASELAAYQQLSEQASNDENLPVASRQLIRVYFERIRPATSSAAPASSSNPATNP